MGGSSALQFAVTVLTAGVVGVPLAVLLTPPDPYTQLFALGILLAMTLPAAYYLSYGGGYESLRVRVQQ
ncbi:hypothetical protein ACM16X_03990 [Haloarcula japonica]|uniref:DUF7534 family protein n=1 Tax=Haloarcula japonica TaxID=29282 RepID=UPI0039F660D3